MGRSSTLVDLKCSELSLIVKIYLPAILMGSSGRRARYVLVAWGPRPQSVPAEYQDLNSSPPCPVLDTGTRLGLDLRLGKQIQS